MPGVRRSCRASGPSVGPKDEGRAPYPSSVVAKRLRQGPRRISCRRATGGRLGVRGDTLGARSTGQTGSGRRRRKVRATGPPRRRGSPPRPLRPCRRHGHGRARGAKGEPGCPSHGRLGKRREGEPSCRHSRSVGVGRDAVTNARSASDGSRTNKFSVHCQAATVVERRRSESSAGSVSCQAKRIVPPAT